MYSIYIYITLQAHGGTAHMRGAARPSDIHKHVRVAQDAMHGCPCMTFNLDKNLHKIKTPKITLELVHNTYNTLEIPDFLQFYNIRK